MESILAKARVLAQAILESGTFRNLRELEGLVLEDASAKKLLQDFEEASLELHAKEEGMQPISPDEKRALEALGGQVASNQVLVDLMRAQGEYHRLMTAVNSTIHGALQPAGEEQDSEDAPADDDGDDQLRSSTIILP